MTCAQQEGMKELVEKDIGIHLLDKDIPPEERVNGAQKQFVALQPLNEVDRRHGDVEGLSSGPRVRGDSDVRPEDIAQFLFPDDPMPAYNFKSYPDLDLDKMRTPGNPFFDFVFPVGVIGDQEDPQRTDRLVLGLELGLVQQGLHAPRRTPDQTGHEKQKYDFRCFHDSVEIEVILRETSFF
jgi:hypothetical protein